MNKALSTCHDESRPPKPIATADGWWKANTLILIAVFATVVLAVMYAFLDPAQFSIFPRCVFHQITGLNCPGCGGQRAIHHLLHGDFSGALHFNALLVVLLPLGFWTLARWALKAFTGRTFPTPFVHVRWIWMLVIVVIAFGVIRNLPGFAWLSP